MKLILAGMLAVFFSFVLVSPTFAQEKKAEKKKAEKASGDVGLLDTEKNYMILVTKEGKLVTLDFDKKTKVTVLKEEKAKMGDIGFGSSASIRAGPSATMIPTTSSVAWGSYFAPAPPGPMCWILKSSCCTSFAWKKTGQVLVCFKTCPVFKTECEARRV